MSAATSPLPPNILKEVFKHLPAPELPNLRCVSSVWNQVIERNFGTTALITNENWDLMKKSSGVRIAKFHSLTGKFSSTVSFTDNLQDLTFHRILLSNNLIGVLQNCTNLRKLAFTRIILDRSTPIEVPFPIHLPHLTILQVHIPYLSELLDYSILLRFLSEIVCKLEEFSFWCPSHKLDLLALGNLCPSSKTDLTHDNTLSESVVQIISNNRRTMELATFGHWEQPIEFYFCEQLNRSFPSKPMQLDAIHAASEMPQHWEIILHNQHYLRCLHLKKNSFPLWNAARVAIFQSSEVIQEVILIDDSINKDKHFADLRVFKECFFLENLELSFQRVYIFQNADCLPASLRYLKLKGHLAKPELQVLSKKMVCLKVLVIDNCEKLKKFRTTEDEVSETVTIDLDIFRQFVLLPNMKTLDLGNFKMNWSKILNWCVHGSTQHCVMKMEVKRFDGTPFRIRCEISTHLLD